MADVVVAQKIPAQALNLLQESGDVALVTEGDTDGLAAQLKDARCIVLGTWLKFTAEWMDRAPNLKVISRTGVGVDNVDVQEAAKRGILVLHTPTANTLSVAEHTVALICALSKYIVFLDKRVRNGAFRDRRLYLPVDLHEKTIGLVGCGAIGRLTAQKCAAAFGMKAIAHDPYLHTAPEGITLVSTREDVFRQADVVSLHIPLTPETRHSVGSDTLSLMKPGAFLVNTSRGGIVDENALCEALREKRIAAAALDVFEQEPLPDDSPLLELDNLILTPHSAALTQECTVRVAVCAAQGVVDFLLGKTPLYIYNSEIFPSGKSAAPPGFQPGPKEGVC